MMNPFERSAMHYKHLSKSERNVCDLFYKNPKLFENSSITDLSKLYGVSVSSIQRFAKQIGYTGFSEFKFALSSNLKLDDANEDTKDTIYSQFINHYSNINKFLLNSDIEAKIRLIGSLIHKSNRTYVVGSGTSSLPALSMSYILRSYGFDVTAYDNSMDLQLLSNIINKDDLVLIFSVSLNDSIYQNFIKNIRNIKGCIIIGITMNPDSKLIPLLDYSLLIQPQLKMIQMSNTENRILNNHSIFMTISELLCFYVQIEK